jgi:hypothetical protein
LLTCGLETGRGAMRLTLLVYTLKGGRKIIGVKDLLAAVG